MPPKRLTWGTYTFDVICIGSSTGGPEALVKLLSPLPSNFPVPIFITQHIPSGFATFLVEQLRRKCTLELVEVTHKMKVESGKIYVATADKHIDFLFFNDELYVLTSDAELENSCRPAVDVMLKNFAKTNFSSPCRVLTLILTGMGNDGAIGVKELKSKQKCVCLTQKKDECVVYGMPKAVDDMKLNDKSLTLDEMTNYLLENLILFPKKKYA